MNKNKECWEGVAEASLIHAQRALDLHWAMDKEQVNRAATLVALAVIAEDRARKEEEDEKCLDG